MWKRRDVDYIAVQLELLDEEPNRLLATVTVNEGDSVEVVGHPNSDPFGAELCRTWLHEIAALEESPATGRNRADEQPQAFKRLAIRVVRAIRRYHSDSPRILVDGTTRPRRVPRAVQFHINVTMRSVPYPARRIGLKAVAAGRVTHRQIS